MSDPRAITHAPPPAPVSPMPLFAWTAARQNRQARRRHQGRLAVIMAAGLALLIGTAIASPRPRLVWNASASAPQGLYRVWPGVMPRRGDMVVAWLPQQARILAARRHYLPSDVPLVKRVAGVEGDTVCAGGDRVTLDGRLVALRLARDRAGRVLTGWQGCFRLGRDGFFLLMAHPDSFDGRYFGATARHDIIGRTALLWAR